MTRPLRRQRIGAAGCGMDIAYAGGSGTVTTTTMTTAIMDTARPMAMDQASVSASAEEADTSVVVIAGKLDASKGNPARKPGSFGCNSIKRRPWPLVTCTYVAK